MLVNFNFAKHVNVIKITFKKSPDKPKYFHNLSAKVTKLNRQITSKYTLVARRTKIFAMGILQVKELRMKSKTDFMQTSVVQIKRHANTQGSHWMLLLAAVCENTIPKFFGVPQIYISMWIFRVYHRDPGVCSPTVGLDPQPVCTDFIGKIRLWVRSGFFSPREFCQWETLK